ncbi:MAG: aminotransferase class I/II-fold pyridoxal phosphate-dependent enzyme [Anaerolineae bacterium]|nr:aminotransferase class I/II-fold pyridoxal phosphate-dependent enzyme [Anaerolineae bacterium]
MKIEPFALERWMTTYEQHVDYDIAESGILPLRIHDLLCMVPEEEREGTLARLLTLPLGYSEACGTEALRTILADTYAGAAPENILVTTGAIEANFLLFNAVLDPGDHVVAPYPAYQQLYSVPRALGCEVDLWRIVPETGFRYDVDDLARLVRPTTRLIVVNSPHNPTGAMLSADDFRHVYDLAQSVGATLMSDEAYRWLDIPGGSPLPPPAYDLGPAAASVGTLSKPFGLPGLRIGWIAAPADVVKRCWGLRDYVTLSPGKLNDALAVLALRNRDQIVARNHEIVRANLDRANEWIAGHDGLLSWIPPRAGLLALLHYEIDIPSYELANLLAEEYSVMLAPGAAFGYEHYLRIGIGQDPAIFSEALERVDDCLEEVTRKK